MSYSPYADIRYGTDKGEHGDYLHTLEPGQLDSLVRNNKMVTILIEPKPSRKSVDFHTDDEFDDPNLKTLVHWINGKYHHSFGDSAGAEMIQHSFKRGGKIANWDVFLTNLLRAIYGSMGEQIDHIADSI